MFQGPGRAWRFVLAACTAIGAVSIAAAQAEPPGSLSDFELRVRRLEQQNEELEKQIQERREAQRTTAKSLDGGGEAPVNPAEQEAAPDTRAIQSIVADYLKDLEKAKQSADAAAKTKLEEEGYRVGTDLRLSAQWNQGYRPTFSTPNGDFRLHIGGLFNFDNVFWGQDGALQQERNLTIPAAPLAFGRLQDGFFFRRLRLRLDGEFWEIFEFANEFAFEQVNNGIPDLNEFWISTKNVIPIIGTVRIGHERVPQGLESYSGARNVTFMERSVLFDAFWNEFAPGIRLSNNYLDQHVTWQAMLYRIQQANDGADFGDGQNSVAARVSCLPIYECEGRYLMHLAASASFRSRSDPAVALLPVPGPNIRFRARPEMRDAVAGFSGNGENGTNGNSQRLVDTGNLFGDGIDAYGLEFLTIAGPLAIQAEYSLGIGKDIHTGPASTGVALGDLAFWGYYIQASYFLTGENRSYDRRFGRLGSPYAQRLYTPFWAVRGDDGSVSWGRGAWEIAARYSFVNLNNGAIQGGHLSSCTLGLNWLLSPNLKIQWQYIYDQRSEKRTNAATGFQSGDVVGLGMRTVLDF